MSRRLIATSFAILVLLVVLGGAIWSLKAREQGRREAEAAATAKVIADVRAGLSSPDVPTRHTAAKKVLELGPLAEAALPELLAALKDAAAKVPEEKKSDDGFVGRDVTPFARAIWAIGGPAEVPLLALMDEDDVAARMGTVSMFSSNVPSRGPQGPTMDGIAVKVARKGLRDKDADVRFRATGALGDMWMVPAVKEALPDLLELQANDPDQKVRASAEIAAGRIGPKP